MITEASIGRRIAKAIGIRGTIAIMLAIACAVLWIRAEHWQGKAADWQRVSGFWKSAQAAEAKAHQTSKSAYRAAQAEAARLEVARLARAQLQQERISNAISSDYKSQLADLRARHERMLDSSGARDFTPGAPAIVAMPGVPHAAGEIDATPRKRLARSCLNNAGRLIAAEQALQLKSLIDWIEAQQRQSKSE